jgi:hypothetical protein
MAGIKSGKKMINSFSNPYVTFVIEAGTVDIGLVLP